MRVVSEKLESENSWVLEKQQVLYAVCHNIGSFCNSVFERRTSTGSGLFASLSSGLVNCLYKRKES